MSEYPSCKHGFRDPHGTCNPDPLFVDFTDWLETRKDLTVWRYGMPIGRLRAILWMAYLAGANKALIKKNLMTDLMKGDLK